MAERGPLCLSVQQPWAWLLTRGVKDVENRTWETRVRGTLGIHAGKTFDLDGWLWVRRQFPQLDLPHRDHYDLGGIVGTVRLVDVVRTHDSPWFVGPVGFVVADARPLPFRPCRGALGLFRPEVHGA